MIYNKPEVNLFLYLAAYALSADEAVRAEARRKAEAVFPTADLAFLCRFAGLHDMAVVVMTAVKDLNLAFPDELAPAVELACQKSLYKCTMQDALYEQLSALLEENGIRHMPLKGYLLRPLYPRHEMRTSGDVDVFYSPEDADGRLPALMETLDFRLTKHSAVVDTYTHAGGAVFEMHGRVADDFTPPPALSGNVWAVAAPASGKSYEYRLTNEDFYLYHIAHLAKHYTGKGCGLRPIADIYVYRNHYDTTLDRAYIDASLQESGLLTFEHALTDVAASLFSGRPADRLAEELLQSVLYTGVYGNMKEMALLDSVKKAAGTGGGLSRQTKTFFLPLDRMQVKYPLLRKAPVLLPGFWCIRAASALIGKRDFYKRMAKSYAGIDKQAVANKSDLLTRLGLHHS